MNEIRIPKKITPDRIKDSIVEVRYTTKIPFEVAIGLFYKSLDDTYKYTLRPINNQSIPLDKSLPARFEIQLGNRPLFFNDKIKIELQPNSVIFNCLNQYISWELYFFEIEKVLKQLADATVIDEYNRIGVRYISEYPDIDLNNCIKFNFTFGMPDITSDLYKFNSEFNYHGHRIILNINNNLKLLGAKDNSETQKISIIDVDVILENFKINSIIELLQNIDSAHIIQKKLFFTLLKEDYLASLNPIY